MSKCKKADSFLAELLPENERIDFVAHLANCSACKSIVDEARSVDDSLRSWLANQTHPEATVEGRRILERKARERGIRQRKARIVLGFATAAATAVLVVTIAVLLTRPGDRHPSAFSETTVTTQPRPIVVFKEGESELQPDLNNTWQMETSTGGRMLVDIEGNHVGLAANSSATFLPTKDGKILLRLTKGAMAVETASHRNKRQLSIEAGDYLVEVVGTRFLIDYHEKFSLSVSKGRVMVVGRLGKMRMIREGQRLTYDPEETAIIEPLDKEEEDRISSVLSSAPSLLSAPRKPDDFHDDTDSEAATTPDTDRPPQERIRKKDPRAPDTETIREWILERHYEKAESALKRRLARNPGSGSDWWLLGECRRRAGRHSQATEAYLRVIAVGSPAYANRARFQAARLFQDNLRKPGEAVRLLRNYLAAAPNLRPLDAEARLRLGKGLMSLGRRTEAENILQDLTKRHPGTGAALQAKQFIQKLQ